MSITPIIYAYRISCRFDKHDRWLRRDFLLFFYLEKKKRSFVMCGINWSLQSLINWLSCWFGTPLIPRNRSSLALGKRMQMKTPSCILSALSWLRQINRARLICLYQLEADSEFAKGNFSSISPSSECLWADKADCYTHGCIWKIPYLNSPFKRIISASWQPGLDTSFCFPKAVST